jgi:hypothetical protein
MPRHPVGRSDRLGAIRVLLGLAGALLALAAVGFAVLVTSTGDTATVTPATATAPGPAVRRPVVARVGVTAAIAVDGAPGGEITVTGTRTALREPGRAGAKPRRGRFLIVTVAVKATGQSFDVNPLDFHLRTADGRRVDEQCCAGFGRELETAALERGQRLRGVMVFDVGPGRHRLVYAPNLDGAPVAEWRL